MNAGVALARAYLSANGFFTVAELPIIRRGRNGHFHEVTDVDLLGVRFPSARFIISIGEPGIEDDLTIETDPELDLLDDAVDVIIAEVKTGKPKINPGMMSDETLTTALMRAGIVPPKRVAELVTALQLSGEVRVEGQDGFPRARIRILAFGDGRSGRRTHYAVVALSHVARFLRTHMRRYREVLNPVEPSDETMALLQLLDKLE